MFLDKVWTLVVILCIRFWNNILIFTVMASRGQISLQWQVQEATSSTQSIAPLGLMSNFESKKVNPRTTKIYLWSKIVRKSKIQYLLEQLLSAKWPDTYVKTADKFQLMWKQLVYFSWYENSWQIYVKWK